MNRKLGCCEPPNSQLLSVCCVPGCQVRIPERSQRMLGAVASKDGLATPDQDSAYHAPSAFCFFWVLCDTLSSGDVIHFEGLRTPKAAAKQGPEFSMSSVAGRRLVGSSIKSIAIRPSRLSPHFFTVRGTLWGSGVLSVRCSEEGRKMIRIICSLFCFRNPVVVTSSQGSAQLSGQFQI